jgi:hypothetical protein
MRLFGLGVRPAAILFYGQLNKLNGTKFND